MKRVWKPLDVGGLRLYKVIVESLNVPKWKEEYIVAADSPSHAARLIRTRCYRGVMWKDHPPIISGLALNIFQPESWWIDGPPCLECKEREK